MLLTLVPLHLPHKPPLRHTTRFITQFVPPLHHTNPHSTTSRVPGIDFQIPLATLDANLQKWQTLIPAPSTTQTPTAPPRRIAKDAKKEAEAKQGSQ
jgi:hypothetical protein